MTHRGPHGFFARFSMEQHGGPAAGRWWVRGALLGLLLLAPAPWLPSSVRAETIEGEACYAYGPAETFIAASHVSISLAKRNALEGYAPFAEATVNMRDAQLRGEILANVTARAMRQFKVVRTEEDREKKEVCSVVRAEVEANVVKEQIALAFNAFEKRARPRREWLPQNGQLRVVNIREFPCPFDEKIQCLSIVVECLRESPLQRHLVRIIWYDSEGSPAFSIKRGVGCERRRDVSTFMLRLPPNGFSFVVDLP